MTWWGYSPAPLVIKMGRRGVWAILYLRIVSTKINLAEFKKKKKSFLATEHNMWSVDQTLSGGRGLASEIRGKVGEGWRKGGWCTDLPWWRRHGWGQFLLRWWQSHDMERVSSPRMQWCRGGQAPPQSCTPSLPPPTTPGTGSESWCLEHDLSGSHHQSLQGKAKAQRFILW